MTKEEDEAEECEECNEDDEEEFDDERGEAERSHETLDFQWSDSHQTLDLASGYVPSDESEATSSEAKSRPKYNVH